jgi:hypothetical protein
MKQQTEQKTMKQQSETIPCALCGRSLDKRADKNNKPYFVCESCGTQYFIRGAAGRERLSAILEVGEFQATDDLDQRKNGDEADEITDSKTAFSHVWQLGGNSIIADSIVSTDQNLFEVPCSSVYG